MNYVLHNAFPIVAAALGNQLGIKVQIEGHAAMTDGERIILPSFDGHDPEYRDMAWGYLAHEAAHIRYTDFAILQTVRRSKKRQVLLNIIEDVRVEALLQEDYPGTRMTIGSTINTLIRRGQLKPAASDAGLWLQLQSYILFGLRSKILRQNALNGMSDTSEQNLTKLLKRSKKRQLDDLLNGVTQLKTTADSLILTDEILELLQDQLKKIDPTPSVASDHQTPSKHRKRSNVNASKEHETTHTPKMRPEGDALIQEAAEPSLEDVFECVKNSLKLGHDQYTGTTFPSASDVPLDEKQAKERLIRHLEGSHRMSTCLQSLVQSSSRKGRLTKRQGHRLESKQLYRPMLGDGRIYRHQAQIVCPNTAIHILVDRSPSMAALVTDRGKTRIDVAWDATMALVLALESIPGVNPAVSAFPGHMGKDASIYEVMQHGQSIRQRAGAFGMGTDGGTPMAEALWFGASRLVLTHEPRKIMLVITDGIPNDIQATRDILERCRQNGIDVYGIGLELEIGHIFNPAITIRGLQYLQLKLFELTEAFLNAH